MKKRPAMQDAAVRKPRPPTFSRAHALALTALPKATATGTANHRCKCCGRSSSSPFVSVPAATAPTAPTSPTALLNAGLASNMPFLGGGPQPVLAACSHLPGHRAPNCGRNVVTSS
eukprot:CAMPEP_0180637668 /NCGR_PEP_ID=MMETSP1037_2-20121125/43805_1 /TAXON_ID=632150 /ORGANISM="Azadinium spinosum, Strain 3D9" /LENGTH=115 /DNA_ID=CAMNT_0022658927 /DNA_START=592 /DNA_END=936 /DNA_ORIENTATION=+